MHEITDRNEFTSERQRLHKYATELQEYTQLQVTMALQRQKWYDAQRKKYFDMKCTGGKDIHEGGEVLRYEGVRRIAKGKQGKLQAYFSGIWRVTRKRGNMCELERKRNGRTEKQKVNIKWLKRYYRR